MSFDLEDMWWLAILVFGAPVLGLWIIYKLTGAGKNNGGSRRSMWSDEQDTEKRSKENND